MNNERVCLECKTTENLHFLGQITFTTGKRKIYSCPRCLNKVRNWYLAHA
jgi:hypothetical protein